MNINVKVVQHSKQRYPTVGDWFYNKKGDLQIRVSRLSDARYEQLVAVHEIVEAVCCDHDGVDEDAVTAFDIEFEERRITGNTNEPGDCPDAPYFKQHQYATRVEFDLAGQLGVDWEAYGKEVEALC